MVFMHTGVFCIIALSRFHDFGQQAQGCDTRSHVSVNEG
jgi:hypothetical protein